MNYMNGLARIDKEKALIAKSRDRLRELIDDAQAVAESSDEAIEDLARAVDTLSRYL